MAPKLTDRRVQRTRRHIHEAFFGLMREKGYEAVTVQDILDRADVGRATFYAHFSGKQEVLFNGLEGLGVWLREQHRAAPKTGDGPALGFSLAMFDHVGGQRALYRSMVGKESGLLVLRHMQRMIAEIVRTELEESAPQGVTSVPLEVAADFAASTFMTILAWWMDNRTPHTAAEVDAIYRSLVMPGLANVLGPGAALRTRADAPERVTPSE